MAQAAIGFEYSALDQAADRRLGHSKHGGGIANFHKLASTNFVRSGHIYFCHSLHNTIRII